MNFFILLVFFQAFENENGNVEYKEFPISGLITCLSDENNLFIDNKSLGLNENLNLKRENTINNDYKSTDDEYFYSLPSSLLRIYSKLSENKL